MRRPLRYTEFGKRRNDMQPFQHPTQPTGSTGQTFRLCVAGHLSASWIDWPCPVDITPTTDFDGSRAVTLISAVIPDQPALFSLLELLRDQNLTLLYIYRVEP